MYLVPKKSIIKFSFFLVLIHRKINSHIYTHTHTAVLAMLKKGIAAPDNRRMSKRISMNTTGINATKNPL
jgi:hypothetical protein